MRGLWSPPGAHPRTLCFSWCSLSLKTNNGITLAIRLICVYHTKGPSSNTYFAHRPLQQLIAIHCNDYNTPQRIHCSDTITLQQLCYLVAFASYLILGSIVQSTCTHTKAVQHATQGVLIPSHLVVASPPAHAAHMTTVFPSVVVTVGSLPSLVSQRHTCSSTHIKQTPLTWVSR